MKKLVVFALTIVMLLSFVGCDSSLKQAEPSSSSTQATEKVNQSSAISDTTEQLNTTTEPVATEASTSQSTQPTNTEATTEKEREPFDPNNPYQPEMLAVQDAFAHAIERGDFPFKVDTSSVSIGNHNEKDITFSFDIIYNNITSNQCLEVNICALNEIVQKGFEVYLNPDCDETVIKDIILCSIMAICPTLNYNEAEQYYLEIMDGYAGEGRSEILVLNGYNIHISKRVLLRSGSGGYRGYPMLHVVAQSDLIPNHDIDSYKEVSSETNVGELVYFTGILSDEYDDCKSYILEVLSDNSTCKVYYVQDKFSGCFEIGETYTFYGILGNNNNEGISSLLLEGFIAEDYPVS